MALLLFIRTYGPITLETGPEGPELEGLQVEKKSKAAQIKPKKLIRRTFFYPIIFSQLL